MLIDLDIPVLMKLDAETADGRMIRASGFKGIAEGIKAKMWALDSQGVGGHLMARIAGGLASIEIGEPDANGVVAVSGKASIMADEFGVRIANLIDNEWLVGASVDLSDDYVVEYVEQYDSENQRWTFKIIFTECSLDGFTIVEKPAFPDAHVKLAGELPDDMKFSMTTGASIMGDFMEGCVPCEAELAAMHELVTAARTVTSFITVRENWTPPEILQYPSGVFERPQLRRLTPFQYDPKAGRIIGHLAGWNTCHGAMPSCVKPPKSQTGYRYYANIPIHTSDGQIVYVGRLVCDTVHAKVKGINAEQAMAHYTGTGSIFGLAAIWEDEFGPLISAAAVQIDPEMLAVALACPPSGDWRPLTGVPGRELIVGCAVPVPGFNTPRAEFSNESGSGLIISNVPLDEASQNTGALSPDVLAKFERVADYVDRQVAKEAAEMEAEAKADRRNRIKELAGSFARN